MPEKTLVRALAAVLSLFIATEARTVRAMQAKTASPQKTPPRAEIDPLDWPHWRGPEWNGISREKGLPSTKGRL